MSPSTRRQIEPASPADLVLPTLSNSAVDGGGIGTHGSGADMILEVVDSVLGGNTAADEGGVAARSGSGHTFVNTTVSGNTSDQSGGGFHLNRSGLVTRFANVTVTGNVADGDGSGNGGGVFLESAELRLGNSILGANFDGGGEALDCDPAGLPIESLGYNLIQHAADCNLFGATATDVLGLAPGLGPLTDHGGLTPTHLPLAGSPAVDGGNPAGCGNPAGGTLPDAAERCAARRKATPC